MSELAEKLELPEIREPVSDDLLYFMEAGRLFTEKTPYSFDENYYAEQVMNFIEADHTIIRVKGYPAEAHCAAMLIPSMYHPDEFICRVFSTWGNGGLECFREVERQAQATGAHFLIADSYIEPRIMKFYAHNGMTHSDVVFLKEL